MKRVIAAWIEQTILFSTEKEVDAYLKKQHVPYKLIYRKAVEDGVEIHIMRSYNRSPMKG